MTWFSMIRSELAGVERSRGLKPAARLALFEILGLSFFSFLFSLFSFCIYA